jgi:hypothetical protein
MRIALCLVFTLMPAQAYRNDTPVVELYVPPVLGSADQAFRRASMVVAEVFSGIGLKVEWKMAGLNAPECSRGQSRATILVALAPSTPTGISNGALAFSDPHATSGACVTLLMDRLKPQMDRNPLTTGFLLGYVLAHEIAHVLQGIARHSEGGILEERWTVTEIQNMSRPRSLRFTPYDIELIFRGMRTQAGVMPLQVEAGHPPKRKQPAQHSGTTQ